MDDDDYYFDESDGDYGGSSYSLEEDHGDDLNDLLVEEPVEKIWTTASVISAESLLAAQKEVLQNVMSLLLINEQQARSLLIHYRWNVQKVSDYFERKGKEPLFQEAGVVISDDRDLDMLGSSTAVITCNVCFEDVAVLDATKMDCGHFFCNDCWTQNFIIRIKDGERTIRCMDTKCNAICDDVIIRNLVSQKDPCLAERLERFLLESYVEDNDNVKWCPSNPHCGNAIQVDGNNHTHHVHARCGNSGSRNAVTKQGLQTGSWLTQSPAPSATSSLKRMVAVTWSNVDVNNISDYSWVLDGLRQLLRSRRVLKYTYPLAFYIFGDELFKDKMTPEEKEIKRHLFEDLQQQLETNVERLSMYVEKDFYDLNEKQVMELKLQVVNLNRVVNKFCGQMYKYIEDDLFEPMRHAAHRIAPYSSGGPKMLLQPSSSGNSGVKPNI
ncbi:IBR domain [Musa troglodytarum]|uniref:RBR-type E3 ubiquitin transferase n=1 Tax=Musa troglodytarum TaxID=320322 RepID=A0A9E7K7A7_9LILI|nr:IBR domain [Musa troglodytarum]